MSRGGPVRRLLDRYDGELLLAAVIVALAAFWAAVAWGVWHLLLD